MEQSHVFSPRFPFPWELGSNIHPQERVRNTSHREDKAIQELVTLND